FKILLNFDYGPTFAATENYFSENIPALKSIGQSTRQISKFNNILKTMKLLPAKVAIIWPISTEIWSDNEGTYNSEREMVWLALDRNQVPVDFLTEKDIEDGYLSHYDVLYGIGDYLNDKAAKNIKSWVEKGGILWAEPGFATKNEYDKSANILGISDIFSSVKSSDKFKEISPGKGKIYVLSSFPGLDYNKSSNRTQNNGYSTQFSKKIADFILTPIEKSVWKPHVQIGLDGIEASLLQNKNYYILFLVNYRKDPKGGKINSLNVEVNQIGKISSVVSADRGNINFTQSGKSIKFSLPLNTVDMIFLKKFYAGQEK
ncbi:MAG: hypothetical protein M1409_06150, partial [Actinobacteria bacterium]|nr:hypothetical protein [Actinomycetota bacterium]